MKELKQPEKSIVKPIENNITINARRNGNTTRIVDSIIQDLFSGKKVPLLDHYHSESANRYLRSIVEKRLRSEHPHVKYIITNEVDSFIKYIKITNL